MNDLALNYRHPCQNKGLVVLPAAEDASKKKEGSWISGVGKKDHGYTFWAPGPSTKATASTTTDQKNINLAIPAIQIASSRAFGSVVHGVQKFLTLKQLTAVVYAPMHMKNLVINAMALPGANREKKIDASLNVLDAGRGLGESIGTFVVGLANSNAITAPARIWTTPFAAVMSALSIASIVKHVRACLKTQHLMREFEAVLKAPAKTQAEAFESYHAVLNLIEKKQMDDPEFVRNTFDMDPEEFADALVARENQAEEKCLSTDASEQADGVKLLEKTISSLKGRVRKNIATSVLSVIAAKINIIGTILLLCCPMLPVGWAFVALGGVVDLTSFLHSYICQRKFKQDITDC